MPNKPESNIDFINQDSFRSKFSMRKESMDIPDNQAAANNAFQSILLHP